jgi:hypothetical protein
MYTKNTVGYLRSVIKNLPDEAEVVITCAECNEAWCSAAQLTYAKEDEVVIGACGCNETGE